MKKEKPKPKVELLKPQPAIEGVKVGFWGRKTKKYPNLLSFRERLNEEIK